MGNIVSEEEMSFIRAVLDNPDDDAVRLIYSDWLEEQGRSFGYIREQATSKRYFFKMTGWVKDARRIYSALDTCPAFVILSDRAIDFNAPYCGWPPTFFEYIRCSAEWWMKNAADVVKYHPIREVHLTTFPILGNIDRMVRPDGAYEWRISDYPSNTQWIEWSGVLFPKIKFVMPGERE